MLASVDGQLVPIPINLDTVNQLYGLQLDDARARGLPRSAWPSRVEHPHLRGRRRRAGRPRALREVLPRLHAQAVGPRPVRARRLGDGARPDAHQPRRPLLHRHLPGDAAARLHADVRAHARPSEHHASCSAPTTASSRTSCRYRELIYTGPIDEYFDYRFGKLPYRSLDFALRDARRRAGYQPAAVVNYPQRARLHPHHRVQVPDRQEHREDEHRLRVSARPRAIPYYPIPRPENARALQALQGARGRDAGRPLRRPAGDLPLLQHGSGRRLRRS